MSGKVPRKRGGECERTLKKLNISNRFVESYVSTSSYVPAGRAVALGELPASRRRTEGKRASGWACCCCCWCRRRSPELTRPLEAEHLQAAMRTATGARGARIFPGR